MSNEFKVGKEFQTNPLSHTPGGVSVIVEYKDGSKRIYDNIKNPGAYMKKLKTNTDVIDAYVYMPEESDDLPF